VAYVLLPSTVITAVPRQRPPNDLMPFFDEQGNGYKERLESAKTALRLVSDNPAVVEASQRMVRCARQLAVHRATNEPGALPADGFDDLWAAERAFVAAARLELGLGAASDAADRSG
jgi:hypothetical protein